jgi:hypothetical protein
MFGCALWIFADPQKLQFNRLIVLPVTILNSNIAALFLASAVTIHSFRPHSKV